MRKVFKLEPESIAIEQILKKDSLGCPVGFISIDRYRLRQPCSKSPDHHLSLVQSGSAIIDIMK